MISLRLHKPVYEWADKGEEFYPYRLRSDVHDWLTNQQCDYKLVTQSEKGKGSESVHTFLICYMNIEDSKLAMLFKLTWL